VNDALDDVQRCLESVIRYSGDRFRLILVDDGSGEECRDYLAAFAKAHTNCLIVRNEQPTGYTRAANRGLSHSTAPWVVLLNSDTVVTPLWLERLLECAGTDPRIGIVGPLSNAASWQSVPVRFDGRGDWALNPLPAGWGPDQMAEVIAEVSQRQFPKVPLINGFCFAIKRSVIEAIGSFDEQAFPQGYGEENDYCLRAMAAGFLPAVADHAYVYHAKSRSYTHDRRQALAEIGQAALERKHGAEHIKACVRLVRDEPALAAVREAVASRLRAVTPFPAILFLLPTEGSGSGGEHSVVQEACEMLNLGVNVQIVVIAQHLDRFRRQYPSLEGIDRLLFAYSCEDEVITHAAGFDVVVATIFDSVRLAKRIVEAHPSVISAYYIQDYEPWFFAEGSYEWEVAMASYDLVPANVLFAKTRWLCDIVQQRHRVTMHKVQPSLDHSVYFPSLERRDTERGVIVAAMVRPSTARRGAPRSMRILGRLSREFGDGVDIHIFGCADAELEVHGLERAFAFKNHGALTRERVADLLRRCHIFLDLSDYQAFGRTGLEAMACGCAVVVPLSGGTDEFAVHRENALMTDTSDDDDCYAAARELVLDHTLRDNLRQTALSTAATYSVRKAALSELALFKEAWTSSSRLKTSDTGSRAPSQTVETSQVLARSHEPPQNDHERLLAVITGLQSQLDQRDNELRVAIQQLRKGIDYQHLVRNVVSVAQRVIPRDRTVAVVSKGDEGLLGLGDRTGWHFPQNEGGVYAGHYPASATAAIDHLEALRRKGVAYLLFPSTAFWWLDHYAEFHRHLNVHYNRVWSDSQCIIFDLTGTESRGWRWVSRLWSHSIPAVKHLHANSEVNRKSAAGASGGSKEIAKSRVDYPRLVARIQSLVVDHIPADATVMVVSKGDDELLRLRGRTARHFPETEGGVYIGHHPADSRTATGYLEALRSKGGQYLVFPSTAFWWLDHYADFRIHLDQHYRRTYQDEDCIIYDLGARSWLSMQIYRFQKRFASAAAPSESFRTQAFNEISIGNGAPLAAPGPTKHEVKQQAVPVVPPSKSSRAEPAKRILTENATSHAVPGPKQPGAKQQAVPAVPPPNGPISLPKPGGHLRVVLDYPQTLPLCPPDGEFDPRHMELHWVVPDFELGMGGPMAIFRFISYLERFGHKNTIWIRGGTRHGDGEGARKFIRECFIPIDAAVNVLVGDVHRIQGDAVIATHCWTAYPVRAVQHVRERFYFVQDYEPSFYPMGAEYLLSEATYRFAFSCITSSNWLQQMMRARYGARAARFTYAYDPAVYNTNVDSLRATDRVAFYARTKTARRAVELGLMALELVAEKFPSLKVDFFGGSIGRPNVSYQYVDHGVLDDKRLAELYRRATIGVVFSTTNHSLIPHEMMACGLPVVEIDAESTRADFPADAVTLAAPTPDAIATRIVTLLSDATFRERQSRQALAYVGQLSWEHSARQIEAALIDGIRAGHPHPCAGHISPVERVAPTVASGNGRRSTSLSGPIVFAAQPEYYRSVYYDLTSTGEHFEFPYTSADWSALRRLPQFMREKGAKTCFIFRPEWLAPFPETFRELKDQGVTVIGYSSEPVPQDGAEPHPDQLRRLDQLKKALAIDYDLIIHYDASSLEFLKRIGFKRLIANPLPVSRKLFFPEERAKEFDVCFLGKSTPHREQMLLPLKMRYATIHVAHGLRDEEARILMNRSKLVLNIHNENYLNFENRVVQALFCQRPILSELLSGNLLLPDRDYIPVYSPNDLCNKVTELLHSGSTPVESGADLSNFTIEKLMDRINASQMVPCHAPL